MFDEIHLQQDEEYVGGRTYGTNSNGELYKGVMSYMIVGLKESIPYVINAVPACRLDKDLLAKEIVNTIECLQNIGFRVRAVVCDNHASNVAALKEVSSKFERGDDGLKLWINGQATYFFFDTVHIMKNIRNNLLSRKRFLFPPFICNDLQDSVKVPGGEISWSLFHRVHEQDVKCQANLKAAPKLSSQVLHPGNSKQSVPVALAIFDPSTRAAILNYFPQAQDSAGFLNLIFTWWTASNSKSKFHSNHKLGNAAIKGDGKPAFFRKLADWLVEWQNQKIPNSQKFTLSAQTNAAMVQTLRCQAALIEDLLSEGYEFVLTARFQSDPLERRYGQYRQMSGGRFLISAKDASRSENILKIKSLVKEGFDIVSDIKMVEDSSKSGEELLRAVEEELGDVDAIKLDESSRKVSDHVAGYFVRKTHDIFHPCCGKNLKGEKENSNSEYINILSRGGLLCPSEKLADIVSQAFALLDASSPAIRLCDLPSKKAGFLILSRYLDTSGIVCEGHEKMFSDRLKNTICNCFFDGQRKRSNESVVEDRVAAFKKNKRNL